MPDQTPPPRPGPPPPPMPMPPQPLTYHAPMPPGAFPPGGMPPLDPAQRVFDTVGGPNLRVRDNLIQLACVAVGTILGAGVAWFFARGPSEYTGMLLIDAVIGMVASLAISGLVIGIIRGKRAMGRK